MEAAQTSGRRRFECCHLARTRYNLYCCVSVFRIVEASNKQATPCCAQKLPEKNKLSRIAELSLKIQISLYCWLVSLLRHWQYNYLLNVYIILFFDPILLLSFDHLFFTIIDNHNAYRSDSLVAVSLDESFQ